MKLEIIQLAIIVKLENGKLHQVALTKQQSDIVTYLLPSLYQGENVKILPTELSLTLEDYKTPELIK